jgi:hypothetical protein
MRRISDSLIFHPFHMFPPFCLVTFNYFNNNVQIYVIIIIIIIKFGVNDQNITVIGVAGSLCK